MKLLDGIPITPEEEALAEEHAQGVDYELKVLYDILHKLRYGSPDSRRSAAALAKTVLPMIERIEALQRRRTLQHTVN